MSELFVSVCVFVLGIRRRKETETDEEYGTIKIASE